MIYSYYPGCTLKTKAKDLDKYARACAEALGVNRSTYANLMTGVRRDSGTPVVYDRRTALACAALAAGLRGHHFLLRTHAG